MSWGNLIVAAMWLILAGAILWALSVGRSQAPQIGYRTRARLVSMPPRVRPPAPAAPPAERTPVAAAATAPAAPPDRPRPAAARVKATPAPGQTPAAPGAS